MDQYYQEFSSNLLNFIKDVNRYQKNDVCDKILEYYPRLKTEKLVMKVYNACSSCSESIKAENEGIFNNEFNVFPGFNLSQLWVNFTSGQKKKIWTYLQMLYIQSNMIVSMLTKNEISDSEKNIMKDIVVHNFNPYIGVGSNNDYTVGDIVESNNKFNEKLDEEYKPELGMSFNKIIGQFVNMEDLSKALQNLDDTQINSAVENITNMLGTTSDDRSKELITNIMDNIKNEINTPENQEKIKSGDCSVLIDLATKSYENMKNQVVVDQGDMSNLSGAVNNMINQLGGNKDGNPLGMLQSVINNLSPNGVQGNMDISEEEITERMNALMGKLNQGGKVNRREFDRLMSQMRNMKM